jgi:hypothetical protein
VRGVGGAEITGGERRSARAIAVDPAEKRPADAADGAVGGAALRAGLAGVVRRDAGGATKDAGGAHAALARRRRFGYSRA